MKRLLTTVLTTLILVEPLWADTQKGNHSLEFHFGPSGYSQDIDANNGDDTLDCPAVAGLQYLYFLRNSPSLAIGPDILWSDNSERDSSSLIPNSESHAANRIALYQMLGKLAYPKGHWRPYVLGGVGAFRSSLQGDITPLSGAMVRTFDSVRYGFAGTWGVGMDFYPREHWYFGLELRQNLLSRLLHDPTPEGQGLGIQSVRDSGKLTSLMLSVGYKFGAI